MQAAHQIGAYNAADDVDDNGGNNNNHNLPLPSFLSCDSYMYSFHSLSFLSPGDKLRRQLPGQRNEFSVQRGQLQLRLQL